MGRVHLCHNLSLSLTGIGEFVWSAHASVLRVNPRALAHPEISIFSSLK